MTKLDRFNNRVLQSAVKHGYLPKREHSAENIPELYMDIVRSLRELVHDLDVETRDVLLTVGGDGSITVTVMDVVMKKLKEPVPQQALA